MLFCGDRRLTEQWPRLFVQVDEHLINDGVQGMLGSDMIRAARELGYPAIAISVLLSMLQHRTLCALLVGCFARVSNWGCLLCKQVSGNCM